MVVYARCRLASLWVSQCAHFLGNYCLRVYVVLLTAAEGGTQRDAAWHLVSALFMLPSVFLVPVYGALGNSLAKRTALVGSAAYCLAVVALFAWWGHAWLACALCVALGSALYTPTRHVLLPAAAHDADLPLHRVVSAVETGAVLSMVAGMVLAGSLSCVTWANLTSLTGLPGSWAGSVESSPLSVTAAVLLGLAGVCLVTALPAHFHSDTHRSDAPWPALCGFFHDVGRLFRLSPARGSLLAVCVLRGLVTISAGALIADSLAASDAGPSQALIAIALLTMLGAGAGSCMGGLIDKQRALGLVPLGAAGMALAACWIAMMPPPPAWLCVLLGLCGGLINVPLLSTYQASLPADARGNGMAILNTAGFVSMTAMSLIMVGLARAGVLSAAGQLWFVAVLCTLAAVAAWVMLGASALGLFVPWPGKADLRS